MWNKSASPQSRRAAFQTFDKMNNLDQKCCLMTLPERKNWNFQSDEKIIAYFFAQTILPVLRT